MLIQRKIYYLQFNKASGKYLSRLNIPFIFVFQSRSVVLKGLQVDIVCLLIDCTFPTVPTALVNRDHFCT